MRSSAAGFAGGGSAAAAARAPEEGEERRRRADGREIERDNNSGKVEGIEQVSSGLALATFL